MPWRYVFFGVWSENMHGWRSEFIFQRIISLYGWSMRSQSFPAWPRISSRCSSVNGPVLTRRIGWIRGENNLWIPSSARVHLFRSERVCVCACVSEWALMISIQLALQWRTPLLNPSFSSLLVCVCWGGWILGGRSPGKQNPKWVLMSKQLHSFLMLSRFSFFFCRHELEPWHDFYENCTDGWYIQPMAITIRTLDWKSWAESMTVMLDKIKLGTSFSGSKTRHPRNRRFVATNHRHV